MSRCAHGRPPSTNSWMKAAAVQAPPARPPTLAMSATSLLSCSRYSGKSGIGQTRSPARSAARRTRSIPTSGGAKRHVAGRLDRDAAGVEGDPLADQRQDRSALAAGPVAHRDQTGRLVGAARHPEQRPGPELAQALALDDVDLEPGRLPDRAGPLGQLERRQVAARLDGQRPGDVDPLAGRDALAERLGPVGWRRALDDAEHDLARRALPAGALVDAAPQMAGHHP